MKRNCVKKMGRLRARGFTLVELMVVIVILGLLAGLVGQRVIKNIAKAKAATAKAQISTFKNALTQYRMDTGQYPDNSVGLDALISEPPGVSNWAIGGYLDSPEIPLDPWGNEYDYYYTGDEGKPFEIRSFGGDGEEGGDGEDEDIYDTDVTGTPQ